MKAARPRFAVDGRAWKPLGHKHRRSFVSVSGRTLDSYIKEFLIELPAPIQRDFVDAIVLAFGRRPRRATDERLIKVFCDILQPTEKWLWPHRAVLIAGHIDFQVATLPAQTLDEAIFNGAGYGEGRSRISSLETGWNRQAIKRWRELRAGPLAPAAFLEFEMDC
jgi:hypothetical protein